MIKKVISGGQTGVDRAGLDAALVAGIPIGGYCPKGRLAEDGVIPEIYPMIEMESPESYYRTEMNVLQSDGTLILNSGDLTEGTRLTRDFCIKYGKPCLVVQLDRQEITGEQVIRWLRGQLILTLNIAGPRESKHPGGIYSDSRSFLENIFNLLKETA
jgi:hypothetical protein